MSPFARRIAQAQDLEAIVERRRRNYFFLLGRLRDVSPPLFNQLPAGVSPLFYPLVVEDKAEVLARLHARGIEAIDFWKHFHPACDASAFPEVAQLRRSIVEIPCHQDLTPEVMAEVATVVRGALTQDRRTRKHAG
jgi:dTDP-4-amino-4,6-dideoxygalactose transaminase